MIKKNKSAFYSEDNNPIEYSQEKLAKRLSTLEYCASLGWEKNTDEMIYVSRCQRFFLSVYFPALLNVLGYALADFFHGKKTNEDLVGYDDFVRLKFASAIMGVVLLNVMNWKEKKDIRNALESDLYPKLTYYRLKLFQFPLTLALVVFWLHASIDRALTSGSESESYGKSEFNGASFLLAFFAIYKLFETNQRAIGTSIEASVHFLRRINHTLAPVSCFATTVAANTISAASSAFFYPINKASECLAPALKQTFDYVTENDVETGFEKKP